VTVTPRRPEEISPRDAKAQVEAGLALLVDVRTPEEWDLVHIPGAVHVPLGELERRHDEIEPGPGRRVLVICHHGVRSLRAALALRAMGRADLAGAMSVAGGIEAWSLEADPGVPRYERGTGVLRLLPRA
jgi:adenylyltransferase/sulfurtransferase